MIGYYHAAVCIVWYMILLKIRSLHSFLDSIKEFVVSFKSRELRVISLDSICTSEEETSFACLYHTEVIEAVAACDSLIADRLKSLYCWQRILNPVISPLSATSSVLQKIVGIPSFFISGAANCVNVSLMMMT